MKAQTIWILEHDESSYRLKHLDGQDGTVLRSIPLEGGIPGDSKLLIVDEALVWVVCEHQVVHRLNFDCSIETLEIAGRGHLDAAAVGGDHLWIATDDCLVAIGRTSGDVEFEMPLGYVKQIAWNDNLVWIAQRIEPWTSYRTALMAIDIDGAVHHRLEYEGHPFGFCYSNGTIFLALCDKDYEHGSLRAIDVSSGEEQYCQHHPGWINQLIPSSDGLLCVYSPGSDENTSGQSWLARIDREDGLIPLVGGVYEVVGEGLWTLTGQASEDNGLTEWAVARRQLLSSYQEIFSAKVPSRITRIAVESAA